MSNHPAEISVIIPARDRLLVLQRVLEGLAEQDLEPTCFQVLVVDDGGHDGAFTYVEKRRASTPFALIPLKGRGRGAGAARNLAVTASTGRVLLFLDADTIPSPSLVRAHLALHSPAGRNECHLGRIDMSEESKQPGQARWNELRLTADHPATGEINFRRYRTANTSISRSAFDLAGGFEESLPAAEDLELAFRLARQGMRFYYHDDIVAVHHHPIHLDDYFQKGLLYGLAVARWSSMHPELHVELARRFGLYDADLTLYERWRYGLKVLLVNAVSIRMLTALASGVRRRWFSASDRLYKALYGYFLRKSYHNYRFQHDR